MGWRFFFILLSAVSFATWAAEPKPQTEKSKAATSAPKPAVPAPPPIPEGYHPPPPPVSEAPSVDTSDAEITITTTTKDGLTHEEYRANGKLFMVKITPAKGKPYYLIDKDGSGEFRRSDLEPSISVPTWVIKSW
jgi:hypothetical protein